MSRKKITEEMGEQEKWYDQAKKVTTLTLPAFIKHLTKDYEHDYGTIAHAVTAAGLAAIALLFISDFFGKEAESTSAEPAVYSVSEMNYEEYAASLERRQRRTCRVSLTDSHHSDSR